MYSSSSNYKASEDGIYLSTLPNDSSILQESDPNIQLDDEIEKAGLYQEDVNEVVQHNAIKLRFTQNSDLIPTMSVSDAVEHIGMGSFQIKILAICGFFTFADAMEMLLLSVLAPVLKCEWLLTEVQSAFITTIVFIGYMFMAPLWGALADHYGRKNILIVVCMWMTYYGFLTSFSPNFAWVLILRGCVGAGIAGAGQSFVLGSEYIPIKWRGRLLISGAVFWTFGALFEIAISALIMPNVPQDASIPGWRILVFVSSIPLAVVLFILRFLPESARFLVAAGRNIEAKAILDIAAKENKQPKLPGELKPEEITARGSLKELFKRDGGLAGTTVGCWILWFTAAFAYYGMVLLSAILLQKKDKVCAIDPDVAADLAAGGSATAICSCSPPSRETYNSMLISTTGEVASIVLNLITLDRFGRKRSMALYLALEGIAFMLLIPCSIPKKMMTVLIFIVRGLSSAFFNAVYIYVAEVYPTRVRALALGSCSAAARVGAIITPFVAQVLVESNMTASLVVYGSLSLFSALVALLMPIETKDRTQHT